MENETNKITCENFTYIMSTLSGIFIDVRVSQELNAEVPIFCTPLGILYLPLLPPGQHTILVFDLSNSTPSISQ